MVPEPLSRRRGRPRRRRRQSDRAAQDGRYSLGICIRWLGEQQQTIEENSLPPLPIEPPHRETTTGSFPIDFAEPARASGWRRLLPWAFGLVTLVALVLVVLHIGTIEQFARLAWTARPEWLLLVCVAQAATYVCASLVWRQALRRAGHPRSLGTLIPLGIAKLFTDQVVPTGGVSGAILVVRGLTRRGVPTNVAMAVLLVGLVSYFAAYLAVCAY